MDCGEMAGAEDVVAAVAETVLSAVATVLFKPTDSIEAVGVPFIAGAPFACSISMFSAVALFCLGYKRRRLDAWSRASRSRLCLSSCRFLRTSEFWLRRLSLRAAFACANSCSQRRRALSSRARASLLGDASDRALLLSSSADEDDEDDAALLVATPLDKVRARCLNDNLDPDMWVSATK